MSCDDGIQRGGFVQGGDADPVRGLSRVLSHDLKLFHEGRVIRCNSVEEGHYPTFQDGDVDENPGVVWVCGNERSPWGYCDLVIALRVLT